MGEYYISRPIIGRLGASKDQTIVVVASPVIRDGKFSGVIASSVKLEPLVERFFGLMKVSDTTEVYIVGESGDIIYTNFDPQAPGYQTFTDKYLVAYSPLTLGVQKWLLIVSSPAQEVMEQARPFHIRQTVMFIATTIIIFLFAVVISKKKQA